MLNVVVTVADRRGIRHQRTHDNAGVVVLIRKDQVVSTGYRLYRSFVGLITRAEQNTCFLSQKFCKLLLELQMQIKSPVEVSRPCTAPSIGSDHLSSCLNRSGMVGPRYVLVATSHDNIMAFYVYNRP